MRVGVRGTLRKRGEVKSQLNALNAKAALEQRGSDRRNQDDL
jgi:hypothetical protein